MTPEPLRPLPAQRHGQEQQPCPPDPPRRPAPIKIKSPQTSLYSYRGLPTFLKKLLSPRSHQSQRLAVSVAVHKPRTDSYSPGGSVHNPRLIPTGPTHTPQSSPPSSTTPTDVDLHQDQTVPKLHTL
ncbi:Conserved protein of unknown function [Mycobacterium canettii CIPT 140060008]|nr:Conserved protein of unknown function [Mycobacterium canettii CIPT 140060008]